MSKENQHIVPRKDGWAVKKEHSNRDTTVQPTKEKAIEIGREIARNQNVELVIHDKHGKIQDSDSYGHDPKNIKDRVH